MGMFFKNGTSMADLVNAARNDQSYLYANVPEMTDTNAKQVTDILVNNSGLANAFLTSLINRIGMVVISNKRYNNPTAPLKKGKLEYGSTVEEMFTNIAQMKQYDPEVAAKKVYAREIPDVRACYHIMNSQKFAKQTVSKAQLRQAFTNADAMEQLVSGVMMSMYNAHELYDFEAQKELISTAVDNQEVGVCVFEPVKDQATANKFISSVKEMSELFTFQQPDYNAQHVTTFCPKADQVLLLTPALKANAQVEQLAAAFNVEYRDFLATTTLTFDNFGRASLKGVKAILCDRQWLQLYDNTFEMGETPNYEGLYINYVLHKWSTYGLSPYSNVVVFTDEIPVISTYTITPTATTVGVGDSVKFSVTVEGTGVLTAQSTYALTGAKSAKTTIDQYGYMVVGDDETSKSITVTATSALDSSKTATATVTIQ